MLAAFTGRNTSHMFSHQSSLKSVLKKILCWSNNSNDAFKVQREIVLPILLRLTQKFIFNSFCTQGYYYCVVSNPVFMSVFWCHFQHKHSFFSIWTCCRKHGIPRRLDLRQEALKCEKCHENKQLGGV